MATFPVVSYRVETSRSSGAGALSDDVTRGGELTSVDTDRLAKELRAIIASLGPVVEDDGGSGLPFPLKTLEVGLTITASGSVGFLGSGATITGEGSIVLTFEKGS